VKFVSQELGKFLKKSIRSTDKKQDLPKEHSPGRIAAPMAPFCNGPGGTANDGSLPETS